MRSTRLVTAAYIVTFVAASDPKALTTETIAKAVQVHPSRVRSLIAALVRADILCAARGARGGVTLQRPADAINLLQVLDALGDETLLAMDIPDPFSRWADHCHVHPTLTSLFGRFEQQMRAELEQITVSMLHANSPILHGF